MRVALWIVCIAGALAASPASGENWRESSSGNGAQAYIDVDSIRRNGDKVSFWRELRWPEPRSFSNGVRYDRMAALYEADCTAMTLRATKIRVNLGKKILLRSDGDGSDDVEVAGPGTTAETDLKAACRNEWPSGGPGG